MEEKAMSWQKSNLLNKRSETFDVPGRGTQATL